MAQAEKALHHLRQKSRLNTTIEKLAFAAGVASPIVTLPQLFKVWWTKDVGGISLTTWGAYFVIAVIMAIYGIIHKEKPLIVMYIPLAVIDALILIGAVVYA